VWSYAQSVAWLFPELERSARRIEYTMEVDAAGSQPSRSERIFGAGESKQSAGLDSGAAASVDGQMGSLLRLHREWRFSGDDAFLRECWSAAVRAMEFALREWDTDGDGILDARMHNTYDIAFYGPDPLGNIYFLAALKAMAAMARHLGEAAAAKRYEAAWARSSAAVDKLLYNGEYFHQRLDDVDEHRYQFGTGVLSDQTLGQLHAHLNGLGYVLPEEHVRSAVAAVFKHNFRPDVSHQESVQRAYALGIRLTIPAGAEPSRVLRVQADTVRPIRKDDAAECGKVRPALAAALSWLVARARPGPGVPILMGFRLMVSKAPDLTCIVSGTPLSGLNSKIDRPRRRHRVGPDGCAPARFSTSVMTMACRLMLAFDAGRRDAGYVANVWARASPTGCCCRPVSPRSS
jgi:hypothetical protein